MTNQSRNPNDKSAREEFCHACFGPITAVVLIVAMVLACVDRTGGATSVFSLMVVLVQQGLLDLDIDVNHYLTSWTLPDSPHTQQSKVTLRNLLSHSAGTTVYGFWGYRPSGPIPTLLQALEGKNSAMLKKPLATDGVDLGILVADGFHFTCWDFAGQVFLSLFFSFLFSLWL